MDLKKGYKEFKALISGGIKRNNSIEKFLSEDFDIEKAIQTKIEYDKELAKLLKQPKTPETEARIDKLRAKKKELNDIIYNSDFMWGFSYEDLSGYDLSNVPIEKLMRIPFSTDTKWPAKSKLPKGFDPEEILAAAKSFKGLGVERLHKHGITGKGVKVAYIDKNLDLSHEEFADRKIDLVKVQKNKNLDFHGYSVLARLMGKNVGIAPDVECVYYACEGEQGGRQKYFESNLDYEFSALKDVIKRVKSGEEIAAVGLSASIPYHISLVANGDKEKEEKLLKKYNKLVKELAEYGCVIFSSEEFWNNNFSYSFKIDPTKENDDLDNYVANVPQKDAATVIDAGKLTPLVSSTIGYKYENNLGCASWSIPQVLGLYCLAKQVNANLTFEEFVDIAHKTARENKNGTKLIDAVELVKEVKLTLSDGVGV